MFPKRKNTDTREKIWAGRKKTPHFEVVAQKGRYKESQKGRKVVAQKDGYKVVTAMVLRRNGGVFSFKISLCTINNHTDYLKFKIQINQIQLFKILYHANKHLKSL